MEFFPRLSFYAMFYTYYTEIVSRKIKSRIFFLTDFPFEKRSQIISKFQGRKKIYFLNYMRSRTYTYVLLGISTL